MRGFGTKKSLDRLNRMIDNAIEGRPIENGFDETRLSALETRLSHYLAATSAAKAQLAEEKARINQLISDISHQTKTPIANLLLYAQILEEAELPPREQDCVHALMEQAEKLNFLVSSLVKASRLEAGIIAVAPAPCEIQRLLDKVLAQALPKAEHKGIALTCEKTERSAVFDLKWTAEALYNLVDNAIKYTDCGGSVRLCVSAFELFVRINVADTGIGVREEDTAKIFSRFYRAREAGSQEGAGIGLYLAREIISRQGGYLKLTSSPGKGSTFSVFLPAQP